MPVSQPLPTPSHLAALALAVGSLAAALPAQVVDPSQTQEKPEPKQDEEDEQDYPGRLRSWELPATVVIGKRLPRLREEDRVGDYGQPRWTAHRRFPSTRVHVVPPGKVELEHWTRVQSPAGGGPSKVETEYEIEFGLPGRFQIDLYAVTDKTGSEGTLAWAEQKFEVRYALADWGELWGNPTLNLEWVERNAEPDVVEGKLLLGGELCEAWHWGSNLVLGQGLG